MQTTLIISMLIISTLAGATAIHYKNRLDKNVPNYHINDKSTIELVRHIAQLSREIRIATYPTECDERTKKIIGQQCDLGNYMEWAGPHLENDTQELLAIMQSGK